MRDSVRFALLATLIIGVGVLARAQTMPPQLLPSPCGAAEHHQFDFWLGDWKVQDTAGNPAGTNQITAIQNGCVLFENWNGAKSSTGNSFNMYWSADKKWHQTWVDNQGGRLDLSGGLQDGKMVLEGEAPSQRDPGKRVRHRISWEKRGSNVRQLWQASRDDGKTWNVLFDGLYVPAKAK